MLIARLFTKIFKDGGIVYWNRPQPTKEIYNSNINILVELIKEL